VAALPITEARQQYRELNEEFIENIGRRFFSQLPAAMTTEQRQAAIESTAALIRDVDALIARVDLVDGTTQAASEANVVRNRLKGLRAVVFTAMYTLNPEQAWFWTEEWQRKEVRPMRILPPVEPGSTPAPRTSSRHWMRIVRLMPTHSFGPEKIPGKRHVIWRRIGGHEIFQEP
jgi:hypothetical protein